MSETDIERAIALPTFATIDPKQFPPTASLREIIRNDARITSYRYGDIIVREGDYSNSVFFVLRGSVRVIIDDISNFEFSRPSPKRHGSVMTTLNRLLHNSKELEARDVENYRNDTLRIHGHNVARQNSLSNIDKIRDSYNTVVLGVGEVFGEIAALSRTPRTATVFVDDDNTELLELRWQGLREIRKRNEGFRSWIDNLYKKRSLATHLAESPLFADLDRETLQTVADQTLFEQYGESEWHTTFNRMRGDVAETVAMEAPIAEQGHYFDGLIMVRAGFARVARTVGRGPRRTLGYVTTNEVFGLEDILRHSRHSGDLVWSKGLYTIAYVDILRIPTHVIEAEVLPAVSPDLLAMAEVQSGSISIWGGEEPARLAQPLVDFLIDNRIINGRRTMLIDTSRCTDCDDCVRACAASHDNNPRFRRHGPMHGELMVANACMHCIDPVCLIDCPTGAIYRELDGQVVINDTICVGCGLCARSCPYDNISLVHIRDRAGGLVVDEENRPIIKATKCDFCIDLPGGPACQRACPHDALVRIDIGNYAAMSDWMNRRQ